MVGILCHTVLASLLLATSRASVGDHVITVEQVLVFESKVNDFTGHNLKTNPQGWKLVRYLPKGATNWHPVDDDLKGTVRYGSPGATLAAGHFLQPRNKYVVGAWSHKFEDTVNCFDEFFITDAMAFDPPPAPPPPPVTTPPLPAVTTPPPSHRPHHRLIMMVILSLGVGS